MSLPAYAVRNYRFIIVLAVSLFALGVIGFLQMPRQEDPDLSTFGGLITVTYPGASVEEVENRILEPLEEGLHELEEIDRIESTATDDVAVINAEFREDVDQDDAYDLLVQKVASIQGELPAGVTGVTTRTLRPRDVVVFQLAVWSATAGADDLREWAEELESRLRVLDDAAKVKVEGAQDREIHVEVHPSRLAETGLTVSQVVDLLAAANGDIPGGVVQTSTRRFAVRPNLEFEGIEDVRNTVLTTVDGRPVRVAHVAEVGWGHEDPSYLTRFNGQDAVFVTVTQKEGRNIFDLADDVHVVMDRFANELPADLQLGVVLDQSASVRSNLHTFGMSLLQGAVLILILVAVVAGWRPAVVVLTALVLSVGISFFLLDTFGIVLHQMSIAGLVTVLGLLVDNAIVVVEGILRERQSGMDAIKAAIRGTERMAAAVASSTATTVAAFVPMMLTVGSVGEFTRAIPIVVSLVLLVSLLVALLVTPLAGARLFRPDHAVRPARTSSWLQRRVADGVYDRALAGALRHGKLVVLGALLLSAACLSLTPLIGMSFFPEAEKPMFLVRVETPRGTNIRTTRDRVEEVDRWLRDRDDVTVTAANAGKQNPQVYYNLLPTSEGSHVGEIFVTVTDKKNVSEVVRELRAAFANHTGVVVESKVFLQGPPVGLPVSIELKGEDLESLSAHAAAVEQALRGIPGAVNVSNDLRAGSPRLDLQVDQVAVGKMGLNNAVVAREIRLALAGGEATVVRQGDEDYPVMVRVAPEGKESFADLERVRLPRPGGTPVPLSQLTRPMLSATYAAIHHTDLKRSVIVGGDVEGRLAADIMAELIPVVESLPLGPEESWKVIGEDEERDRAFLSMLTNVITALGLIYGILVLQFSSFKQPLVVFASLPVALTGSAVGLLVGGWSFGFTSFIGLLALTGIVVNNAIVLVDQVNRLRREGRDLETAVREGARSRLQPILLTTGTTVGALLPLTLSRSSLWSPMGWVIIGGLVVSTVVTLFLVPALYTMVEGSRRTEPAPAREEPAKTPAIEPAPSTV